MKSFIITSCRSFEFVVASTTSTESSKLGRREYVSPKLTTVIFNYRIEYASPKLTTLIYNENKELDIVTGSIFTLLRSKVWDEHVQFTVTFKFKIAW